MVYYNLHISVDYEGQCQCDHHENRIEKERREGLVRYMCHLQLNAHVRVDHCEEPIPQQTIKIVWSRQLSGRGLSHYQRVCRADWVPAKVAKTEPEDAEQGKAKELGEHCGCFWLLHQSCCRLPSELENLKQATTV